MLRWSSFIMRQASVEGERAMVHLQVFLLTDIRVNGCDELPDDRAKACRLAEYPPQAVVGKREHPRSQQEAGPGQREEVRNRQRR